MKKILIFILSSIIIITTLAILVGARNEDNYTYVIQFQETQKAYPIMNSEADAIGFLSYYQTNNLSLQYLNNTESTFVVQVNSNGVTITIGQIYGSYPPFQYTLTPDTYDDFGIIYKQNNYYIVVWENGEVRIEESWSNIMVEYGGAFAYNTSKTEMSQGYYVDFPTPPIPSETTNIVTPIVDTISEFINGIGYWFSNAFTIIFLDNGSPNSFSITLLIFFGVSLAYGVVRYVVGLFRKET